MADRGGSASQMKRGFVRLFILANLYREPLHGYGIIKRISERSGGFWSPQPGNIYPLMGDMVKEGLIERLGSSSRRKLYTITPRGKAELLKLFGEAEDSIVHLIGAMNRNEGEWMQIQMRLLEEIAPGDQEERIRSMLGTIEDLLEVLAKTRDMFREFVEEKG